MFRLSPGLGAGSERSGLIIQPQRKLHQPRQIDLRTDHPELRIPLRFSGWPELHAVHHIEELSAELYFKLIPDRHALEDREVVR
jgi:hypothetical protein